MMTHNNTTATHNNNNNTQQQQTTTTTQQHTTTTTHNRHSVRRTCERWQRLRVVDCKELLVRWSRLLAVFWISCSFGTFHSWNTELTQSGSFPITNCNFGNCRPAAVETTIMCLSCRDPPVNATSYVGNDLIKYWTVRIKIIGLEQNSYAGKLFALQTNSFCSVNFPRNSTTSSAIWKKKITNSFWHAAAFLRVTAETNESHCKDVLWFNVVVIEIQVNV